MRYYIVMPIFVLLLLIFQATILDLVLMGRIKLEISLLLVIYAGVYLDYIRGAVLSFTIGFFLDCISSVVPGLFVLFYLAVFFISKNVSYRIYSEGMTFIVLFTFLCALAEGIIIFLMYRFLFGMNISYDLLNTYLPQSLAVAIVGPACFALFSRLEVLMYDKREK